MGTLREFFAALVCGMVGHVFFRFMPKRCVGGGTSEIWGWDFGFGVGAHVGEMRVYKSGFCYGINQGSEIFVIFDGGDPNELPSEGGGDFGGMRGA